MAQTAARPLSVTPENPPQWDAGGGVGLLAIYNPGDPGDPYGPYTSWDTRGEVRFDVGRYWSTHLKSEVGVSLPQRWTEDRCGDRIPVTGLPFGYACSSPMVN
jgi:hypothetical protein